ncbi:unnamed protein product [Owenia fusiformis]|uniref:Uncharacterized protein n=1 Tax=Owenia fusiformis TaxID=6347 RepID=A0A8J1UIX7_OWEFU|nr:unnamed protein product [Owenia fusiformis]
MSFFKKYAKSLIMIGPPVFGCTLYMVFEGSKRFKRKTTLGMPENAEDKSLRSGEARVKFAVKFKSTIQQYLTPAQRSTQRDLCASLAKALWEIEESGAAPVAPDGKVGGNGAVLFNNNGKTELLISKSGKDAGKLMDVDLDVCLVTDFNREKWSADFCSESESVLPSSDTPLHHTALINTMKFDWSEHPTAALHGHAIADEASAKKLDIPISTEETLFSTPADSDALMNLIREYPYPAYKIYIRKGHGFVIMGKDVQETIDIFNEKVKPYCSK